MAELLKKIGYGQVEPNRILARKNGGVVADVPASVEYVKGMGDRVENGRFMAWDVAAGFEGNLKKGELVAPTADSKIVGLVYSETKLYSEYTSNKDFALFTKNPTINQVRQSNIYDNAEVAHETVVPRILIATVGDVFTTNMVETADGALPELGAALTLNDKGELSTAGTINVIEAKVAQITTMPDGQPAVKVVVTGVNYGSAPAGE